MKKKHLCSPSCSLEHKKNKPMIDQTQSYTSTVEVKTDKNEPTTSTNSPQTLSLLHPPTYIKRTNITTGTSSFIDLVQYKSFVDKTMLIKELINNNEKAILITCPRRFGKTTNMDMIKTFLEIVVDENGNDQKQKKSEIYKLFTDISEGKQLKISGETELIKQHFGKYPVISISFKDVKSTNYETVLTKIQNAIFQTFECHKYVYQAKLREYVRVYYQVSQGNNFNECTLDKKDIKFFEQVIRINEILLDHDTFCFYRIYHKSEVTQADIEYSLKLLSKLLYNFFNKQRVYVLVDEYDTPVNYALQLNSNIIKDINALMEGILCNVFKDNDTYLEKGLMTGISVMAKNSGSSGLNNIDLHPFLSSDKYSKYYGFTDKEVNELLNSPTLIEGLVKTEQQPDNQKSDLYTIAKKQVKSYYNGYLTIQNLEIYNPWSIMKCLKQGSIKSYWEDTGYISHIKDFFKFNAIKNKFEKLIDDHCITLTLTTRPSIDDVQILQRLLHCDEKQITHSHIDLFFSYIFESGYLTPTKSDMSSTQNLLENLKLYKLPNQEIKQEFIKYQITYYIDTYKIDRQDLSNAIANLNNILSYNEQKPIDTSLSLTYVKDQETTRLLSQFETSLEQLFKKLDFSQGESQKDGVIPNESLFHTIVGIITIQSQASKFGSEVPFDTGMDRGRADIMASYKTLGIIIEIKYQKTAEEALQQIQNKKYNDLFLHCKHIEKILDIGINLNNNKEIQSKQQLLLNNTNNPSGSEAYDEYDISNLPYHETWNKYYLDGIKKILALRIKDLPIDIKETVVILTDSAYRLTDVNTGTNQILKDVLLLNPTDKEVVLLPYNIDNKHWIGLIITKNGDNDTFQIKYLDPANNTLSQKLLSALQQEASNLDIQVNISQANVEQQKYNNCGPEVIENFIQALTGSRLSQESAVKCHSQLVENALLANNDLNDWDIELLGIE